MATAAFRRPYPRYRINAYQAAADNPISDMNTTPLIDVLLVLLVVLIMAVPIATHKLDVDLPGPDGPNTAEVRQVAITISPEGQVFLDGQAMNRTELGQRLAVLARQDEQPLIRFQPDPQASYDASVQVIAQVGDAGLDQFAFTGNEQFRTFGR